MSIPRITIGQVQNIDFICCHIICCLGISIVHARMKRVYAALGPQLGKKVCACQLTGTGDCVSLLQPHLQLRNILEFDGGIADTYLHPAQPGVDKWNVITHGTPNRFRLPPGSQPQPRIPGTATIDRTYSIAYFPRDVRRNKDPLLNVPIEESFSAEAKKLLETPATGRYATVGPVDPAAPPPGSLTGMKNPDVFRYDPSGLRTTMTANTAAMNKSLAAHRADHHPYPAPALHGAGVPSTPNGKQRVKRQQTKWATAQLGEW